VRIPRYKTESLLSSELAIKNVSSLRIINHFMRSACSIEEAADMTKLSLQGVVVWAVLSEETSVVLTVLKQILGCTLLSEIVIALFANPGQEITARLKRGVP